MKKDWINRWYVEEEYIKKRLEVINSFSRGRTIENDSLTEVFVDLKGLAFAEKLIDAGEIKTLTIKKSNYSKIDFSYADFSNTHWSGCTFNECIFNETVFNEVKFTNCDFKNLSFSECRFKGCNLGLNISNQSGNFKNVTFKKCILKYINFCFPVIDQCTFDECLIDKVDFDGSRFKDTIFIGKLESADFRGYSLTAATEFLGLFSSVDPKKYRNNMIKVDFSQAQIKTVGFTFDIDLTQCTFPVGDDYILIRNPFVCYEAIKEIVNKTWNGASKVSALNFLDLLTYSQNNKNMKLDFLSRFHLPHMSIETDTALFELIREVNSKMVLPSSD